MGQRGLSARAIARRAGLTLVRVAEWGVVRQVGPVLETGVDACDDAIATVGCRRMLRLAGVGGDEQDVKRLVERYGYAYVAEEWGMAYQHAN